MENLNLSNNNDESNENKGKENLFHDVNTQQTLTNNYPVFEQNSIPTNYYSMHDEDSLINKDPEEFNHFKNIVSAFFNYQVTIFTKLLLRWIL